MNGHISDDSNKVDEVEKDGQKEGKEEEKDDGSEE